MEAMEQMDTQELISALADGQLRGEALARGVQAVAGDASAREAWCAYHVVGEVLRTGRASTGTAPEAFLARFQQRLAAEPTSLRPIAVTQAAPRSERAAANDWRWKLVAGVASAAAVTAVGWNVLGAGGSGLGQPQLAAAPAAAPALAQASAAAMLRDPRLDRLLAAHHQFSGGTALQTPSGFLRNATFEGPAR